MNVFTKKLLDYANSSNKEFAVQNAAMLNCIINPYVYYNKFVEDVSDEVLSNRYIKSAHVERALINLANGQSNVTNDDWYNTRSSAVVYNNYMSFDRKRSTRYIMDMIKSAGFAPDMVKDTDFYIMKKVPKTMSSSSKAYNDILFWTFSKDPDFLGFTDTDRLVAVTHGADVI